MKANKKFIMVVGVLVTLLLCGCVTTNTQPLKGGDFNLVDGVWVDLDCALNDSLYIYNIRCIGTFGDSVSIKVCSNKTIESLGRAKNYCAIYKEERKKEGVV